MLNTCTDRQRVPWCTLWQSGQFHHSCDSRRLTTHTYHYILGLDQYHAGARYRILSAAAIPTPIPGCTNFLYWKCNFVRGIGYTCMQGICVKIQYRLGSIRMHCNVLTVATGKRTTGQQYWRVSADTRYRYWSNPNYVTHWRKMQFSSCAILCLEICHPSGMLESSVWARPLALPGL